jgi:hypothetical protein
MTLDMADSDVFGASPERLACVLGLGDSTERVWSPEDLAAIFAHQMRAPVSVDLGAMSPGLAGKLRTLSEATCLLLKSFADLFQHSQPPLELLKLVKEFAKLNRDKPDSLLPNEIATALYYLSIAAALVRLGQSISALPKPELRRGFVWLLAQPWLSGPQRELAEEAQRKLTTG